MDRSRRPLRLPAPGVTATTLVVLVAMGAMSAPAVATTPDGRTRVCESKPVRAVAAAVAAVARDFIGGDRHAPALPELPTIDPAPAAIVRPAATRPAALAAAPLDERLIDLPPPRV